jgi:hypothetical protein
MIVVKKGRGLKRDELEKTSLKSIGIAGMT